MEFNAPATENLFDRAKLVGKSTPRIDGPLKVSGAAPYAAERHDVAAGQAYGWIVGAAIAKGRIRSMELGDALLDEDGLLPFHSLSVGAAKTPAECRHLVVHGFAWLLGLRQVPLLSMASHGS